MLPWDHVSQTPKWHLDRFTVFAQLTSQSRYTLQRAASFPLKIAHSRWMIWTPCNTRFLESTRVLNPNGVAIVSAVFALLTYCDRQTDPATRSVAIGRVYLHT